MAVIEAIATQYLEADAASVTFSSIPSTYEHLELRGCARSNQHDATSDNIFLTYNGDTSSVYSYHTMTAQGSSTWAGRTTGAAYILFPYNISAALTQPTSDYSGFTCTILDYAEDGNKNSTVTGFSMGIMVATSPYLVFHSGLWDSTADITSLTLTVNQGDFLRGSEFTLYGLNSS